LIGTGVDDALHVLTQYRRAFKLAASPERTIRRALHHSGRAIVTTSAALSLGFLTLMASAWETISSFGLFITLAILGALLSTLLVLPAVLLALERTRAAEPLSSHAGITTAPPVPVRNRQLEGE
jgi:predicted RND superfamily exporter protein